MVDKEKAIAKCQKIVDYQKRGFKIGLIVSPDQTVRPDGKIESEIQNLSIKRPTSVGKE